ncbi:MAG: acyloxyacyl hydrolase [Alphaproteobacteria bacterium]|nr:acyloxyacyl hydrolase [Alphaproteobacteria bacterium]
MATKSESRLAIAVGATAIGDGDDQTGELRVEWLGGSPFVWQIKPMAGAMATADGALYGFAGAYLDVPIKDKWTLTPSFAVGLFSDGSGHDLGHTVEFRSQVEVSYLIWRGNRLGLAASHYSNAGLGDRNPGMNSLVATYSLPMRWILP